MYIHTHTHIIYSHVCIYMSIRDYIHRYTYIHTHIRVQISKYICIPLYAYTCIHMYNVYVVFVPAHAFAQTYLKQIRMYTCMCIYVYALYVYAYI